MLTDNKIMNIKIVLLKNGISQTELANKIGISRQYLNGILAGKITNPERERQLLEWLVDNI